VHFKGGREWKRKPCESRARNQIIYELRTLDKTSWNQTIMGTQKENDAAGEVGAKKLICARCNGTDYSMVMGRAKQQMGNSCRGRREGWCEGKASESSDH